MTLARVRQVERLILVKLGSASLWLPPIDSGLQLTRRIIRYHFDQEVWGHVPNALSAVLETQSSR